MRNRRLYWTMLYDAYFSSNTANKVYLQKRQNTFDTPQYFKQEITVNKIRNVNI